VSVEQAFRYCPTINVTKPASTHLVGTLAVILANAGIQAFEIVRTPDQSLPRTNDPGSGAPGLFGDRP
jgi:hypothetical protein